MTNLTPNAGWDDVPQLETTTKALGGPSGPMNLQAQALLNRTEALNPDGQTAPATLDGTETWSFKKAGAWAKLSVQLLAAWVIGTFLGFYRDAIGFVYRTIIDKLRDHVNVKDFGAIWDGEYHPLSERFATLALAQAAYPNLGLTDLAEAIDGVALNAAIKAVGASGGGVVHVPNGVGVVHIPPSMVSTASATFRVGAVTLDQDYVIVRGGAPGASTIKCYATDGSYGASQELKLPLTNGAAGSAAVTSSWFEQLTMDNNAQNFAGKTSGGDGNEMSCLYAAGLTHCQPRKLYMKNAAGYGIGAQNGGFRFNRFTEITIENTGHDGMDVKDNGAISIGNTIRGMTVINFGQLMLPSDPFAGVDVMGAGWHLDDIIVTGFGAVGSIGAGIRFKQGSAVNGRGNAGERSTLGKYYVEQTAQTVTGITGVHSKASYVAIDPGHIVNISGNGIVTEQPYNVVTGAQIIAAPGNTYNGILARDRSSTDSLFLNSDGSRFIGCTVNGFATGLQSISPRVAFDGCLGVNCATPFIITGANCVTNILNDCQFSGSTVAPTINGASDHKILVTGLDSLMALPVILTPAGTAMDIKARDRVSLHNNGAEQFRAAGPASAVNRVQVAGAIAGSDASITAVGESNAHISIGGGRVKFPALPTYDTNDAAVAAGRPVNSIYKTSTGALCIVY